MFSPNAVRTVSLSLAAALTILMLLGIDSLAQPDAQAMSEMAHVEPRGRASPGT